MSWSSRLPSFGGRWSPFSTPDANNPRSAPSQPIQVQESDYSYINPDDLDSPTPTSTHVAPTSTHPSKPSASRPPRDTDVLIFRHKTTRYPVHFPAYGISDGQVTIGDARLQAARKLDVADPKRVRMFYKGRNLKDDRAACRTEGLLSEGEAEILCVVGNEAVPAAVPGPEEGDSESDSDGGAALDATGEEEGAAAPKRKRNRNRKKKGGKKNNSNTNTSTPTTTSGTSTPTPIPSTPLTPLAKLDQLATLFRTTLLPQCVAFTSSPPADPAKRAFDHKRITETVMGQILLKLDAVEVEGEEGARGRRKELVREVQGWLGRCDEIGRG